ncbi:hypothetical protein [Demequina sediminicola]|uniref:hypothetical protein n=1 Tax=Demequina sediminicola TaxID=1095026 RepID=UPI0007853A41|nr:hypothetical protein [Demequina sediminicola]
MRNVALTVSVVAACAIAGCTTTPNLNAAGTADQSPEASPAVTHDVGSPQSETTADGGADFWALAPLGDGEHIRVLIEDRARVGDCEALHEVFDRLIDEGHVEGYTDNALTYVDLHLDASGCEPGTGTASQPETSPSPSPSETYWG